MEKLVRLSSSVLRPAHVVAVVALGGCGGGGAECVIPPCAMPLALIVTVSNAASGGVVPGATFQAQGQMNGSGPCNGTPTTCPIAGNAGTYTVTISAPGFQSATRTVEVTGTEGGQCHCDTVNTGHLDVALVAN